MLAHRLRRSPNINPALVERLVVAGWLRGIIAQGSKQRPECLIVRDAPDS